MIPADEREGNNLPPTVDQDNRVTADRESMLYSYQNTVATSYVGDIRHFVKKFGDYLVSKSFYWDPKKNVMVQFPVRYAAPNVAFSDDKGSSDAASEASIKDRLILPLTSYYLNGIEYDSKRAIDPSVRFRFKPKTASPQSRAIVSAAPRPTNYSFQVDLWTETREQFYQLVSAFQLDFSPYSYLYDIYDFVDETEKTMYQPYAKMQLDSFSDNSNFVPGTDRRVVRGTFRITVEGWITQPPVDTPFVLNTISSEITE